MRPREWMVSRTCGYADRSEADDPGRSRGSWGFASSAAADRGEEMDLALQPHGGVQAAGGHDVVDGHMEPGREGVAPAETRLDAGVQAIERLDDLADGGPLDGHPGR